MPTQSSSWTDHEGVVDYRGNSYFVYRNGALPGGARTLTTKTCTVSGATGVKDLYLKFTGSGTGLLFNFNWWKFDPIATGTGSSGGNCREKRNEIKIITTSGKVKTLQLDYSSSVSQETLNVCLFDSYRATCDDAV